jgi:hypothetical protein
VRVARWRTDLLAAATGFAVLALLVLGLFHASSIQWPDTSHAGAALNRISTGRWENWKESLSYLDGPVRWLFGIGLSRNLSFVASFTNFHVPVRGANADNFFVDTLGRAGLVGLGLFLGLVASLALRLLGGLRDASSPWVSERTLGLAALVATVVLGMTESGILTWGWLHAMVAWPIVASAATRPTGVGRELLGAGDALVGHAPLLPAR